MTQRQLLHTLPMRLRVTMSPGKIEREISSLQDEHAAIEGRCKALLSSLQQRLALWRRFHMQLEVVQQSVQQADYMIEVLAIQGTVDYDRLLKATERLEVSLYIYFFTILTFFRFFLRSCACRVNVKCGLLYLPRSTNSGKFNFELEIMEIGRTNFD